MYEILDKEEGVGPKETYLEKEAQKEAYYAAMSIPYIDNKIEMMYDTFSPDIEELLYEKTRFENEFQNNNFNMLYVVRELI